MPFTSLLGQFKGAVRTPQYAKAGLLPGRIASTYTTLVTCQQPRLSEWTKLWRPPPIKYSPLGPVIRELRATTNFTKPELYDLPNVYYAPLWRYLITKKEHNNRPTARSFWSLPKVDFYSTMRQHLGIPDDSSLKLPSATNGSRGTDVLQSSPPSLPNSSIVSLEGDAESSINGATTHTSRALPTIHEIDLAASSNGDSKDLARPPSAWVVPDEWKLVTSLTIQDLITPQMLLRIIEGCTRLRRLSANIHPPSSSQDSDDELGVSKTHADKLETLLITTSAELYPIFKSLHLPNLKTLSVEWHRSLGHEFPSCHPRLGLLDLLTASSSLTSLSLFNIFPPEHELLVYLQGKQAQIIEELVVRGDYTPPLDISSGRLVTGKTLSTLSEKPFSWLRNLDISHISANDGQLSHLMMSISSQSSKRTPRQLTFSFLEGESDHKDDMKCFRRLTNKQGLKVLERKGAERLLVVTAV
ncbi:hypothetical protein DXG03_007547 [Asterophora parasitica]|uniref:Uncharacterized protein n=1 Tax=Asterophora parasitica TaxID=117018 RepID=A0A9P7G547_9AGAR|nr:hypothetical protein DXG03_007547 [Asterophora parasitica]